MRRHQSSKQQQGVGLIEVLVSLVLLSFCLLGMAALQASALRNNQSAQSRSMATIMSASISESMRANITAAKNGAYNVSPCATNTSDALAASDVNAWARSLKSAIGQTACGGIACTAGLCDITVQWDDSRATSGVTSYSMTTRIQL